MTFWALENNDLERDLTKEEGAPRQLSPLGKDMLDALLNAKGFLDTPISRRRNEGECRHRHG